jgi:hypothetical protein
MTEDELIENLTAVAKVHGWMVVECRVVNRDQMRMALRDHEGAYRVYGVSLGRRGKTRAETLHLLYLSMVPLLRAEKCESDVAARARESWCEWDEEEIEKELEGDVFCSCQPFEDDLPSGPPDPNCDDCDGTGRRPWGL